MTEDEMQNRLQQVLKHEDCNQLTLPLEKDRRSVSLTPSLTLKGKSNPHTFHEKKVLIFMINQAHAK